VRAFFSLRQNAPFFFFSRFNKRFTRLTSKIRSYLSFLKGLHSKVRDALILDPQVDESDIGSDPTIRRNSIGIRVAEPLTNLTVKS
jgi:hypothetical protein